MSTTVEVKARLSVIDNLTGRLGAIAGNVAALTRTFNTGGMAAFQFGQHVVAASAMAGAGIAWYAARGQQDLDASLRMFQVVGNATEAQRKQFEALVMQVAPRIGTQQLELIKGGTELLQAGLMPEDLSAKLASGVTLLERLGLAARVSGTSLGAMAVDLVTLARSFNMPWGNAAERAATLEKLMGIAAVAPRLSPDTPSGHVRALAEFGAIAHQMGMRIEEASALQNVLSSAGFPNARGGMALKTILQRFMNPTFAAQQALQLAGFNYGRAFSTNLAGLSPDALISSLGTVGINAGGQRALIARMIQQGDGGNILGWKANLAEQLASGMGLRRGDVRERGFIKRAIDNIVAARGTGVNTLAWLEEMAKLPVAAFKDVAGLHHATKAAVLALQGRLADYAANLRRLEAESPTAITAGGKVLTEGWDFQLRRNQTLHTTLQNAWWNTGMGGAFTDGLKMFNDQLERMGQADPETIKMVGNALLYVGGAGAGLMAVGATLGIVAATLSTIATRGPAALAILAALGLIQAEGAASTGVAGRAQRLDAGGAVRRYLDTGELNPEHRTLGARFMEWWKGRGSDGPTPSLSNTPPQMLGGGRATVTIRVEGPGRVTGIDTDGSVNLRTGDSMTDSTPVD